MEVLKRRGRVVVERLMLAVACIVAMGAPAFATGETGCAALTGTTGTMGDAIGCVFEKVAPMGVLTNVLTLFIPVLLVLWGTRGGFALMGRIVSSIFGLLVRRG